MRNKLPNFKWTGANFAFVQLQQTGPRWSLPLYKCWCCVHHIFFCINMYFLNIIYLDSCEVFWLPFKHGAGSTCLS